MEKTERKIIFFDVDGTLTDADGNVPEDAVAAIKCVQANGHICVVNTGRPYLHLVDQVKEIGFDAYICSCGGFIAIDGKTILHESFSKTFCNDAAALARRCRLDMYYESEEGLCIDYSHKIDIEIEKEVERFISRGIKVNLKTDDDGFYFDKFCIWLKQDSDIASFEEYISPYMDVIKRSDTLREYVKKGVSKATGIKKITEYFNIPFNNTYAIGDSPNDLLMLSNVQHSVAMGEAPDDVKDIVEYTTDRLENGGIKKALKHFDLL